MRTRYTMRLWLRYMTKEYKNEDILRKLYVEEGLSQNQIARRLDCSLVKVRYWMDKHGISVGENSEGWSGS
jgi:uncharacterized protein YjcR